MRVTYTLTVDTNAVPAGKLVRCWLPYPRTDQARQRDVKFISASEPEYVFSPQECRHSTLYMEKRAVQGEPTVFSETFEYTSCGLPLFIKSIPPSGRNTSFSLRGCVSWLPN